ncbi:phage baseplate assembly protein V [Stutzerimonas frequens]|uniref:Phage baseplate assembly protein V n=1 Tax=Stutzerimonas frequens TaxID=2968969 RepID=A0ABX6XYC4_9GAMM|nr:phage baseplate assembly protein V [Stutzerimonas frequens]MCQ4302672.1 phage baseplate assembly protein V [Stutzerimonas frequens]PNF52970.1 phage baseplate assembly protein V [Stutzerimonas frequens]QPT19045.1 phage baseplate assembly protein V [Stutzerimonas frequens]
MNIADLARLLENIVRFGTIEAVQMQPPRVQVKSGNITTAWRPWLNLRAGADREWDPPTVGEQVVLLSPSGNLAQGVALTGLFSDLIPANGDREGLHRRTYRDGAVIEYDSIAKRLLAILPDGGQAELQATGGITILGDVNITGLVTVSEDVVAGPSAISFIGHKHTGVQTGPSQTGVPVP